MYITQNIQYQLGYNNEKTKFNHRVLFNASGVKLGQPLHVVSKPRFAGFFIDETLCTTNLNFPVCIDIQDHLITFLFPFVTLVKYNIKK